MLGGGCMNWR